MIKSLRFSNFYSFADEAQVDFSLGKKPTPSGFDIELAGYRLNKVIAVVGANGSG
ncbi:MAG: abortive infection protein, partial [Betaproteobacteria bacterium]|nr:abortive infection protein [Betaproteobacteria bacterium]